MSFSYFEFFLTCIVYGKNSLVTFQISQSVADIVRVKSFYNDFFLLKIYLLGQAVVVHTINPST